MEKTFELKSFKTGDFGVDCKYRVAETNDDGVTTEQEYHVKVSRPVHPDLRNLFENDLAAIVTGIFDNTQYSAAQELEGEAAIIPTGVCFAGKNDNIGISILGAIRTKFGRITFKTPRIKYLTGESEICAKLTVFADAIVNEANAYLFDGKTAEMEVFGE